MAISLNLKNQSSRVFLKDARPKTKEAMIGLAKEGNSIKMQSG